MENKRENDPGEVRQKLTNHKIRYFDQSKRSLF